MKQLDSATLLQLIDSIYTAAVKPEHWAVAIGELGKVFRSHYSNIYGFDIARAQTLYFHSNDTEPEVAAAWMKNWAHQDARLPAIAALSAGKVLTNDTVIDRRQFSRSAVYNEFLVPTESEETLAVVPMRSDSVRVILTMNRSGRIGTYSSDEIQFLEALTPHLQRAALISTQLQSNGHAQQLSRDLMNHVSFGVIVLSHDGKILEINSRAHHLLNAANGLLIKAGQLCATDKVANNALQKAINSSISMMSNMHRHDCQITVPHNNQRKPLQVTVSSLPIDPSIFALRFSAAAVFIFSADDPPELDPIAMANIYGLTKAEIQVALQLVQGHSLKNIAANTGTTIHTIRTHLKHALAKTECETQAQLVRTLLLGPAVIRR